MADFFIYCRKSEEDDDRQILSIDSQITELTRLAESRGFRVVSIFTEARSAKAPGRPVFNDMMERISRGEAQAIVCWKLDRLARNPVDCGRLIWATKAHGLTIVTPSQTFRHLDDNTILMYVEFGIAQKYVDDLSKNVRRGLQAKARLGWFPTIAPIGYLNSKTNDKGAQHILCDPERFPLVRRMWDLMLTGAYTPPQIRRIANEEWGFRTRPMKKLGRRPLAHCMIYRILTDPFYYGSFEYPRGSGQWWKGRHRPMITKDEYDRVQMLLGRKGKPRPIKHRFAYTGLIRCGECRGMVTAEEKHQIICSECRFKFSSPNKDYCPRCRVSIVQMGAPKHLRYTYYHCGKRKNPDCSQRSLREADLDEQVAAYLARIAIPDSMKRFVDQYLHELEGRDQESEAKAHDARRRALDDCERRLANLVHLHTAPQNVDGSLLSEAEYAAQRSRLLRERTDLEGVNDELGNPRHRIAETLAFAYEAPRAFTAGDATAKRQILVNIGSNLTLTAKTLSIEAQKPFVVLADGLAPLNSPNGPFEPRSHRMDTERNASSETRSFSLRRGRYDDRTLARKIVARLYRFFQGKPERKRTLSRTRIRPRVTKKRRRKLSRAA